MGMIGWKNNILQVLWVLRVLQVESEVKPRHSPD